jgi:hypothetical protein
MAIFWRSLCQQCFYKFNPTICYRSFISRQYYAINLNTDSGCHKFGERFIRTNGSTKKYFSDKPQQRTVSVVVTRGPLQWIANKIKLFLVNSYFDADFEEETFLKGAKQVTVRISFTIIHHTIFIYSQLFLPGCCHGISFDI